jgi:predicted Zn-dependent protease
MRFAVLYIVILLYAGVFDCATVQPAVDIGNALGVVTGNGKVGSLFKAATSVGKSFQDITPEQEYYIGRAVAATVLGKFRPFVDEEATQYINIVGQTLAQASDKPETFGGYHFLILDSDEINAFAAPGGLILVTRGMLRNCKSEDALAAVLAHEIAHVAGQHGLKAIKSSRITSAFSILGAEGVKTFGAPQLAQLTEAFEGSVNDIVSNLMKNGYSRELEREADQSAVIILSRVGYDPRALPNMLAVMDTRMAPGTPGFAKTHPDPKERIRLIDAQVRMTSMTAAPIVRQKRFDRLMKSI